MTRPPGIPPAAVVALLCVAAAAWSLQRGPDRNRRRPFRTAYWYWHHPFRLSTSERQRLHGADVGRLYVHGGTITAEGSRLRLTSLQEWEPRPPCEVWAVFRVHSQAIQALTSPGGAGQAAGLVLDAGLPPYVSGIQCDADVPTAHVSGYADFIRRFRAALKRKGRLFPVGVTALPDWIGTRGYSELCEAADEVAPQFYGNDWPRAGRRPPPLWETRALLAKAGRSSAGRARTWVGLPAYGRCILTDARGAPIGIRHDIDPDDIVADPAWRVEREETRCEPWIEGEEARPVEDLCAFKAAEEATAGPVAAPAGTRLWLEWPRLTGLRECAVQLRGLPGIEGVCLFRWPAPGEPLALPVTPLRGATPCGQDALRLSTMREGDVVRVRAFDPGPDGPYLGVPVELEIRPAPAEVLDDSPVEWRAGALCVSPARADRVLLRRPFLRPGRTWGVDVEAPGATVTAILRWKDATGKMRAVTSGETGEKRR